MSFLRTIQFRSIRTKLVAWFLAIGMIPLAVVAVSSYQQARESLLTATKQRLQDQAEQVSDKLDRLFFERYGDVQAFATNPDALGDTKQVTEIANTYTRVYGIYDLMIVADLNGKVIGANTIDASGKPFAAESLVGTNVKGEPWFEQVASGAIKPGQSYFGDVAEDSRVARFTNGRGLSIPFSAPVLDAQGKVVRVWGNFANWDRTGVEIMTSLRKQLSAKGMQSARTGILNKQGLLIEDDDPQAVLKLNLVSAGLEAAKEATSGKSGATMEQNKRTGTLQVNGYAGSRGALGFPGFGWGVLVRQDADEACAAVDTLATFCTILGAVVAVIVTVISFCVARILANPLRGAVAVLERVAEGDFTSSLEVASKDEIGQMAGALNSAVARVRSALLEVRTVADGLSAASGQLAASAEEISSGAQEQASSLEETASSLEEITSTIRQNADNAQQANQLSSRSREVAEKGGDVVANAVNGMKEINDASKKIADIITTIDEIAFQTNLLALNAAVEAARAGEQGRGFAVVAGEVRNLAQRSAAAAKEIKGLIQDSVRKVEVGSDLVNQSGRSLEEIIGSVKRVTDIIAEISAASREQASGIEQVNKAVAQMDQVTQSNASQTEELSGTAEGLAGQAETLQQLVQKFVLEQTESQSTTAPATKPAAAATAKPASEPSAASRSTNRTVAAAKKPARRPAVEKSVKTAKPKAAVEDHDYDHETHELDLVGAGLGGGRLNGHGSFEEF